MKYIILFITLYSIASADNTIKPIIDSDLLPYVNEFEKITSTKVSIVDSVFLTDEILLPSNNDDLETKDIIGLCTTFSNKRWLVQILRSFWNKWWIVRSDIRNAIREQLVFHELTHCMLNRRSHNIKFVTFKANKFPGEVICPKDIMQPSSFTVRQITECYLPYHDYYMNGIRKDANVAAYIRDLFKKK